MDDFYQGNPIVFEFGKGTEIVQAEVVETIPDGIAAEVKEKLTFGSGKLTIAPLLLNRYSFIKLKVKLAHFNGEVHAGHMQIVGGKLINFDEYFINKIVRNPTHNPIITIFHLILAALIFCAFAPLLLLPAYLGLSLVASVLNTSLDAATDTLPGGIAFLAGLIIGLYCLSKLSRFIDLFFNFRGKIKLF